MKTTFLLFGVVFTLVLFSTRVFAQYSAKNLTRKIVPQPGAPGAAPNQQQKRTATPTTPTPTPPTSEPTPAPTPVPAPPPVVRRPTPVPVARPVDPEKERAAQEKADQKAIEFEKKRADQDYGWAQYALGVRYMTGKGVEKDPDQARKWLEKAAKNGESQAAKKLAELDKDEVGTNALGDKPAKVRNVEKPAPAEQVASDGKAEKK